MLKLKSRLNMAAQMVRKGSRLADIGTDHAYLPAALILDGTVPCAIAADLRKGPLENAEATVKNYGIAEKVQLRLSDGLKCVNSSEVDDIVIAGMGGILISEILEAAPWVKNENIRIYTPKKHEKGNGIDNDICRRRCRTLSYPRPDPEYAAWLAISAFWRGGSYGDDIRDLALHRPNLRLRADRKRRQNDRSHGDRAWQRR